MSLDRSLRNLPAPQRDHLRLTYGLVNAAVQHGSGELSKSMSRKVEKGRAMSRADLYQIDA